MSKEVVINNQKYEITQDEKNSFNKEVVEEKLTEYFGDFDIIVGDWAYGKLRLKGFNNKNNKNFKELNNADKIGEYIEKYCAYGCKWFQLEKK